MATSMISSLEKQRSRSVIKNKAKYFDKLTDETVRSELKTISRVMFEPETREELLFSNQVRSLRSRLRNIAYNAEDILDTRVSETYSTRSIGSPLLRYLPSRSKSKELDNLLTQMRDVKSKLEDQTKKQSIHIGGERGAYQVSMGHRQADDDYVVGIQDTLENLVKSLQEKDGHYVLAIVGMGGAGKTTLARFIYNHHKVKKQFKYQAWVSLARGWSTGDVVAEICEQLQSKVKSDYFWNRLRTSKCLIVLDDVWDCEKLQKKLLPNLFEPNCNHGNKDPIWNQFNQIKIVITSRHHHDSMENKVRWNFHEVALLSIETGLELFNKVVFGAKNGNDHEQEYRGLALEMLKKCGGLPLAIVALAKLLKTKDTIREWEAVFFQLRSKEGPNDLYLPINDILSMSYHDLTYKLKPCFLYFGLFPEDFLIKAGPLIKMWIAENFVQTQDEFNECTSNSSTSRDALELQEEDTLIREARELLKKLIEQTMVQVVKWNYNGIPKTLRVHNTMRDLCIMEAREVDFLTQCSLDSNSISIKTSRRATINLSKSFTLPVENSHLRSLFVFGQEDAIRKRSNKENQEAVLDLALVCDKFKLLRVLNVDGVKTSDGIMPKEICNLIHLRYLRIKSTNIRELPISIGKLRNLLTLDYWKVLTDNRGIKLPNVLWKMNQLRHLYLPYEMNTMEENFKLSPLRNIQTLWGVKAGKWMYKDMQKMSSKLKKVCIQGISNFELMETIFDSPVIKENGSLYSLALDWYGFEFKYPKTLSLISSLRKLKLMGNAPDLSNPLKIPPNLWKLELYYTRLSMSESLKALGELKCLKYLKLDKDSYMGNKWSVAENEFPQLEELKMSNLPNLKDWEIDNTAMPLLKKVSIYTCINLIVPQELRTRSSMELHLVTKF